MKHKPDPEEEFCWWHFYDFADQRQPEQMDKLELSRFRIFMAIASPKDLEEFMEKQKKVVEE